MKFIWRKCIFCGKEIIDSMGFVLFRDIISGRMPIREICEICGLEIIDMKEEKLVEKLNVGTDTTMGNGIRFSRDECYALIGYIDKLCLLNKWNIRFTEEEKAVYKKLNVEFKKPENRKMKSMDKSY